MLMTDDDNTVDVMITVTIIIATAITIIIVMKNYHITFLYSLAHTSMITLIKYAFIQERSFLLQLLSI